MARYCLRSLRARHGVDQAGDRGAGQGLAEAAQAAGVRHLAAGRGHRGVIGDGLVDRLVGDLDAGIAGGEQPDEDRAADRRIGVGGVGRVAPGAVGVLLLRGDRGADGQLEGLADRPRPLAVGPEVPLVDGAISLGQAEHGEAVVVHGVAHDAGAGVLGVDDAPQRLADVVAVRSEVGVLARGEEDHQAHPGDARPLLAALPVALLGLGLGQVLQAAVVHLAHVARDDLAGTAGEPLGSGRGGQPQEEGQGGDAAGQRATSRDRGMIPGGMPTSSWAWESRRTCPRGRGHAAQLLNLPGRCRDSHGVPYLFFRMTRSGGASLKSGSSAATNPFCLRNIPMPRPWSSCRLRLGHWTSSKTGLSLASGIRLSW